MQNSNKDRRDHKLRHLLKEFDRRDDRDIVFKEMGMNIHDLHSAIRLTCSVKGARDCSRSAYKHLVKLDKAKMLKKVEEKEINEEKRSCFTLSSRIKNEALYR